MKAIWVQNDGGVYQIRPTARAENWSDLKKIAERIEDLGPLTGWGQWTHAYRLHFDDGTSQTYFAERKAA